MHVIENGSLTWAEKPIVSALPDCSTAEGWQEDRLSQKVKVGRLRPRVGLSSTASCGMGEGPPSQLSLADGPLACQDRRKAPLSRGHAASFLIPRLHMLNMC